VGSIIDVSQNATNNGTIEKYCNECGIYSGLYQWDEAMNYNLQPGAQGICPAGWHIPTKEEFQTLSNTAGGDGNALRISGEGADDWNRNKYEWFQPCRQYHNLEFD
jgi:uncharacterized protein (TIGR02145 family)